MYVCTGSSLASYGQELEAGYALDERRVKILVLVVDGASLPPELRGRNRERVRSGKAEEDLRALVQGLPDTLGRLRRLETTVVARAFPAARSQPLGED
jgi:hypothetical protein